VLHYNLSCADGNLAAVCDQKLRAQFLLWSKWITLTVEILGIKIFNGKSSAVAMNFLELYKIGAKK
jgi:hypothetical protein